MTYKETKESTGHFFEVAVDGLVKKIPLGHLREEGNFQAICGALEHESSEIAIGASLLLGRLQDDRAIPYLLDAFLTTHGKKAQAVSWALGEIGDQKALPFLTEALLAHFVPKSVIIALGKIGSPASLDILLSHLNDPDESIRALAAKAIGQLKLEEDQKLLSKALAALLSQLKIETARTVKLVICVVCGRMERAVEMKKVGSHYGV